MYGKELLDKRSPHGYTVTMHLLKDLKAKYEADRKAFNDTITELRQKLAYCEAMVHKLTGGIEAVEAAQGGSSAERPSDQAGVHDTTGSKSSSSEPS